MTSPQRELQSDTKGWIPTHSGRRTRDGRIRDPFIRNADAAGPLPKPYMPFFLTAGGANAWCRHVGAVKLDCEYSEAQAIARRANVELVVSS